MSFELRLLSSILDDRDLSSIRKKKITADFFFDPRAKELFKFIQLHYVKYGQVPSLEVVKHDFPSIAEDLPKFVDDSPDVLCDKVREKKVYTDIAKGMEEVVTELKADPMEAFKLLREKVTSLTAEHSEDKAMDITRCKEEILNEYDTILNSGGMLGIPYPWPTLNKITMGMNGGELIVVYARPKSLKTWVTIKIAQSAQQHKKRVLFATKEMNVEQIRRRAVALFCGLDYEAYRAGKLTTRQLKEFRENLDAFEENPPFVVTNISSFGLEAIVDFRAKIEEYDAEVAFFDGIYLCARDWQELAQVTRTVKSLAQEKHIPIIINTQKNRTGSDSRKKGGTDDLSDLAYGDSLGQDADLLLRLHYDDFQKQNKELLITLPGVRESKGASFTINAKVAGDLSEKWVDPERKQEEIAYGEVNDTLD